jgi:hypothetical protein
VFQKAIGCGVLRDHISASGNLLIAIIRDVAAAGVLTMNFGPAALALEG